MSPLLQNGLVGLLNAKGNQDTFDLFKLLSKLSNHIVEKRARQ